MTDPFQKLMAILNDLDKRRIGYSLMRVREDSIMIQAAAPGNRWEIEVMGDGSVEVEVFRSDGKIHDAEKIEDLLECYAERLPSVAIGEGAVGISGVAHPGAVPALPGHG